MNNKDHEWEISWEHKYGGKIETAANYIAKIFSERKRKNENSQYVASFIVADLYAENEGEPINTEYIINVMRQVMTPIVIKDTKRKSEIGFHIFSAISLPPTISYESEFCLTTTENGTYFFEKWDGDPDTVEPIIMQILQIINLWTSNEFNLDKFIDFIEDERRISK